MAVGNHVEVLLASGSFGRLTATSPISPTECWPHGGAAKGFCKWMGPSGASRRAETKVTNCIRRLLDEDAYSPAVSSQRMGDVVLLLAADRRARENRNWGDIDVGVAVFAQTWGNAQGNLRQQENHEREADSDQPEQPQAAPRQWLARQRSGVWTVVGPASGRFPALSLFGFPAR